MEAAPELRKPALLKKLSTVVAVGAAAAALAGDSHMAPEAVAETTADKHTDHTEQDVYISAGIEPVGLNGAAKHKHTHHVKVPRILRRIGGCESGGGPHARIRYRAQNPVSSASGGYQFLYSAWGHFRGYAQARDAPPWVQDRKAVKTFRKYSTRPWLASKACWD
jgi:Transglycosylase-like domain